jgi:FKBP-type peptidyl-prolyl cis-trans isomerase FkpA
MTIPNVQRWMCLALPAVLCACAGEANENVAEQSADTAVVVEQPLRFAPELGVQLDSMMQTPSGVHYVDVRAGRGAAATIGKSVTVEYKAWLPDGTLYEQRPNAAEGWGASEFVLGTSAPVPGLDEGMDGMRAGGVRRIVVPADQGYGLIGRPADVPANSPVVFEIRLLSVRD